jgi:PAS domain S-box-containing protein
MYAKAQYQASELDLMDKARIVLAGEASYHGLFNSLTEAVFILDAAGRFVEVNEGAVKMFGHPREFFIGKTIESLSATDKNDMGLLSQALLRAFEGVPQHLEFWGLRCGGEIFPEDIRLYKETYFGQDVVITIVQDISERKKAESIRQRQLLELTILHTIALAESTKVTVDEVIAQITEIIGDLLYLENCGVLLLNPEGNALKPHPSYRGTSKNNIDNILPISEGVTGKVAASGKALRVDDVSTEPAYYEVTEGVRSELCVPIVIGNQVNGVLNVESNELNAFALEDERLLNTIAGGLAATIERQRLFEKEQAQKQRESAMLDLMRVAASSLNLDQVLETILGHLLKLIPSESGTIQLLEGDSLRIAASLGFEPGNLSLGMVLPLDHFPLNAEVIKEQHVIRIDEVDKDDRFSHIPGTEQVRSMLAIPLFFKGRVTGMITLDSHQNFHFKEKDEELGMAIANHAAIAIENARLFEEEQRRRRDAENLREAAAALTKTIQIDSLYEIILDSLSKLVPYDSASIEILKGDQIEIVAGRGLPEEGKFLGKKYTYLPQQWDWLSAARRPVIIPDVRADEHYVKFMGTKHIRGWMGVPMFTQDNLIGYLNVYSREVNFFTEEHAALAQTFADQSAIAIENAGAFQEERRRTRIIESLAEIANEIAASGEVGSLLDKVARRTLDLLQASHVAIYLVQHDNKTIKVVTAQGTYSKELMSHTLKYGEGITGNIIAAGKPEIVNDTRTDPRRMRVPGTPEKDGELETMMSCPLILHGTPIGAINVWRLRSNGFFDESELNFLINIANQASRSIELGRLLQETLRRAQESSAIAEVGRDISSTLELDMVLERIAASAKELLWAETSAVYLYDPSDSMLRAIAVLGADAREIKNDPLLIGAGILGQIAKSKTGEIVNDTVTDPRAVVVKGTQLNPFEHIMGVPVLTKDQLTGLLVVWRTGAGLEFNPSELDFLSSLAQQVAVAIENARLFQLEQKRRQEAETLQTAASAITSSLEPKQVLETILIALQQVIPYDSAAMMLIEDQHVRIVAARGFPRNELLVGQVFPASNGLLQEINKNGQVLILEDAQQDLRFEKWVDAISVRGWMGVPLIARGKIIGYFTIDSHKPGAFDDSHAALAQTFAHQASAAIENARLYNETRQRLDEQEIISRISVALRSAQDSTEMLPILLDEIMASIGSNTCAIWLYDPDQNELIQRIASGWFTKTPINQFKPDEGMVGHVFITGQAYLSEELSRDPMVHPENNNSYGEGWAGITIPIKTRTDVIGVLAVALPPPRRIEPNHVRLLTTITEIAGNAIHRVNLFQRSEEQVRQLTALREVDTAIASSFDLNVTLDILANHIMTQLGADAVSILSLQADQLTLVYLNGAGFKTNNISEINLKVGEGVAGKTILSRADVYIKDLSREKSFKRRKLLAEDKFVSYYAVPMISKGQPQGVVEVFFRETFTPNPDWIEFIQTLTGQAVIAIDNSKLFEDLQRTNQELSIAYDTTLEGWGKALELRDKETQGHTRRVTDLTLNLARQLGLPESSLVHIRRGVLLHDIGKMGVSDRILHKEGPLSPEEREIMENHPLYAYELLSTIPYLKPALDIPYCHHEWWNGEGYPRRLKGEQIPLAARLFAIVDVWDALLSDRPYRKSWTKQKAIQYLCDHSETQFDPKVLEIFLKIIQPNKRKK